MTEYRTADVSARQPFLVPEVETEVLPLSVNVIQLVQGRRFLSEHFSPLQ